MTYKDGKKNGWLRSWDGQFRRSYWCEYFSDRRNGLCCLFEHDEPIMVAEYELDHVRAIHRISGGKLRNSFRDEEEVKRDDDARPVWERLVQAESELGEHEKAVKYKKKNEEDRKLREILVRARDRTTRERIVERVGTRGAARSSLPADEPQPTTTRKTHSAGRLPFWGACRPGLVRPEDFAFSTPKLHRR